MSGNTLLGKKYQDGSANLLQDCRKKKSMEHSFFQSSSFQERTVSWRDRLLTLTADVMAFFKGNGSGVIIALKLRCAVCCVRCAVCGVQTFSWHSFCSFIYLCLFLRTYLFTYSFINSCLFTYFFVYIFIYLVYYLFIFLFSLIHLYIHSFIFVHLFIYCLLFIYLLV
jgi:hypothetical protein